MKYSLGLDIGTTSVGWAVVNLDKNRIEDLGVRIFEKPENPKDGKPLAEPRRTARSARRRLNRRRQRLNYLKSFFVENKLLTAEQIEKILTPHKDAKDPYDLREKGLQEKLKSDELFIALYHIAKRRGYKSNRKKQDEEIIKALAEKGEDKTASGSDKERKAVLSAISRNSVLLEKYETVAVTLNNDSKFVAHKRNKADDYSNSFIRENFLDEIEKLLKAQGWDDEKVDELLNKKNYGLFYQRPFMTAELIEKMRGKCPFEKDQPRVQKASITFETFRLAQDLAHLTYNNGQKLTEDEIRKCVEKCKATEKVTYKAIREVLGYKSGKVQRKEVAQATLFAIEGVDEGEDFRFDYVRGKVKKGKDGKEEDPEKNTFAELKFYHGVKKALKNLPEDWKVVEGDEELFDEIGYILTANKDDEAIEAELKKLSRLSGEAIVELMKSSFAGFGHLSLTALKKITPFILEGETYDKAVEKAYPGKFTQKLSGDKNKLPPLNEEEAHQITNPVVKRAISQTIKVVNAVIIKYGAPTRVGIECANELAKNFKDRNEIKKSQDENAAQNEEIVERLKNEFGVTNPTGLQITKFKFYNEQNGKCPYCGKAMNLNQLFSDEHYGEVDHIIPFSRSGNDGRGNKVLVHNECNQNKRNQTPYEVWGTDEERWGIIESFTKATYHGENYRKQLRLIAKTPPKEDWNARALNDTRYITKFMSQFMRKNLKFSDERKSGVQKVFTPTGGITSYLRRVWHVGTKDREENNLHHAVDAVIVALVTQGVIQSVSNLNKYYELFRGNGEDEITDRFTGEMLKRKDIEQSKEDVLPWTRFDDELRFRMSQMKENEKLSVWRDKFRDIYKDQGEFIDSVRPIFVSRMPNRKANGPTNDASLRSKVTRDKDGAKSPDGAYRTKKENIKTLTPDMLENSLTKITDPRLYEVLTERIEWGKKMAGSKIKDADGKEKKFGDIKSKSKSDKTAWLSNVWAKSVYKKDKKGNDCNIVRSIKVFSNQPSGFYINGGEAFVNNGAMVRVDIYRRKVIKGKRRDSFEHLFVPIYVNMARNKPNDKYDGGDFVFSLFSNDYFIAYFDGEEKPTEGYFVGLDSSNNRIKYRPHSSVLEVAKLPRKSFVTASLIQKIDISVLGDNYRWS